MSSKTLIGQEAVLADAFGTVETKARVGLLARVVRRFLWMKPGSSLAQLDAEKFRSSQSDLSLAQKRRRVSHVSASAISVEPSKANDTNWPDARPQPCNEDMCLRFSPNMYIFVFLFVSQGTRRCFIRQ